MSMTNKVPPRAPPPVENNDEIPRSGWGATSALLAMLKKRQMRASAEPLPSAFVATKTTGE
jgi:hypothetical protein